MENIPNLVSQCQEGRLEAFDSLFNHFQHRVHDLARTMMGDESTAEDVVQDTFLAVFQKIDGFKGDAAFETWLIAITVNQCRMKRRKQSIRQFLSLEQMSSRRLYQNDGRKSDLAEVVQRRQQRQTLWDMVDCLDERLRLPIILRYRYDYSCGEIADILKFRTSTIYQRLNEGRRRLGEMQRDQEVRFLADETERKVLPDIT